MTAFATLLTRLKTSASARFALPGERGEHLVSCGPSCAVAITEFDTGFRLTPFTAAKGVLKNGRELTVDKIDTLSVLAADDEHVHLAIARGPKSRLLTVAVGSRGDLKVASEVDRPAQLNRGGIIDGRLHVWSSSGEKVGCAVLGSKKLEGQVSFDSEFEAGRGNNSHADAAMRDGHIAVLGPGDYSGLHVFEVAKGGTTLVGQLAGKFNAPNTLRWFGDGLCVTYGPHRKAHFFDLRNPSKPVSLGSVATNRYYQRIARIEDTVMFFETDVLFVRKEADALQLECVTLGKGGKPSKVARIATTQRLKNLVMLDGVLLALDASAVRLYD